MKKRVSKRSAKRGISFETITSVKPQPQVETKTPIELAREKASAERKTLIYHERCAMPLYQMKMKDARDRGIRFDLTFSEVVELKKATHCAYSGKELVDKHEHPLRPTMERINPFFGYVENNVVTVSYEANQEKSGLDSFMKGKVIPDEMKLKLLRKAEYVLIKKLKEKE